MQERDGKQDEGGECQEEKIYGKNIMVFPKQCSFELDKICILK